jgi:hypothetical protein
MSEEYESKVTLTFTFKHDGPHPSSEDAIDFVEQSGQLDRGCIEMKVLHTEAYLCETTIHEEMVEAVCTDDAYSKVNDMTWGLGNEAWRQHYDKQTPAVQAVLDHNKEEIMKEIWNNFSCKGE